MPRSTGTASLSERGSPRKIVFERKEPTDVHCVCREALLRIFSPIAEESFNFSLGKKKKLSKSISVKAFIKTASALWELQYKAIMVLSCSCCLILGLWLRYSELPFGRGICSGESSLPDDSLGS